MSAPLKFLHAGLMVGWSDEYRARLFSGVQYCHLAPNTYGQPTQAFAASHAIAESGAPSAFRCVIRFVTYSALFTSDRKSVV